MHGALWEALRAGLVLRQETAYTFLHDRIQQAAYSLIAEERRADVHLRIGRALLAGMTADQLAEHLFDVASQFSRGAARLIDHEEKAQVAAINLRAGEKPRRRRPTRRRACIWRPAWRCWTKGLGSEYELTFGLWLERAECEFQIGDFDRAAQLIAELLHRATSKVDRAAVYVLEVRSYREVRNRTSCGQRAHRPAIAGH